MRLLLFLFLAGCAVKCDDSNNYYVIQMPDDPPRETKKPFRVYWNVPSMQCRSKKIPFKDLYENYGIIQNANDSFRGEKIAILYDPGMFPALLKNETTGQFRFRNGGVPQEGDLNKHLESFKSVLEQSIPDPNFSGVGIIDFESWRPVYRQNFGVLMPYKDVSYEIERKAHWWWPKTWIQAEAKRRFEEAARIFMQNTISVAKRMRPRALWGYYGFPYCFNMGQNHMVEWCADNVHTENDNIDWLWAESEALYPSVYSSQQFSSLQLQQLIRGRVNEAARVRRNGTPILPYFWFRYRDGGFLSEEDLQTVLKTFVNSGASGFIIWGSSADVNTVEKCKNLLNYTQKVLGPAIAKYTKPTKQVLNDEIIDTYAENNDKTSTTTTTKNPFSNDDETVTANTPIENNTMKIVQDNTDPEFQWNPPENYTQDIVKYVEEELFDKNLKDDRVNDTDASKTVLKNLNDSILLDFIKTVFGQDSSFESTENETEKYYNNIEFTTEITEVANTVTHKPSMVEVTEINDMETSTYSKIEEINKNVFKSSQSPDMEFTSVSESETNKYLDSFTESTHSSKTYDKFTTENIDYAFYNQEDLLFVPEKNYYTSTVATENNDNIEINSNIKTTSEPSEEKYLNYNVRKVEDILPELFEKTSDFPSRNGDVNILEETFDLTTENPSKDSPNAIESSASTTENIFEDEIKHVANATPKVVKDSYAEISENTSKNKGESHGNDIFTQTLTSTEKHSALQDSFEETTETDDTTSSIELISKDRKKGMSKSIIENRQDDTISEELATRSADQVAGSAFNNRPRYYFCIIFYFYSVSKCLCDMYGQCS